jgi:histidinol-phosphate aminotransferase
MRLTSTLHPACRCFPAPEFDNLVILQTFSKAWGMAGLRLGMAFASPDLISVLNKIKYPYNLNILTQQKAMELLSVSGTKMANWVQILLEERVKLEESLKRPGFCGESLSL